MKYAAVAGVSLRQNLAARGPIIARLMLYGALVLVFSRLWTAVSHPTLGMAELVWYLALTELVTISIPFLSYGIEQDVKRGDIAYKLAQPISYLWARVSEAMGEAIVRFLGIVTIGFGIAWLCAGGLPGDPRGILLAIPLSLLAIFLGVMIQAAVGLSALWLQESGPTHFVVQKLMFVFGGLLFPLDIYPDWLRNIALCTPFSAMLYGCGRLAFGFDPALAAWTLLLLLAWGVAIAAFTAWLYRRALRSVSINGG